jgi:HK97 family phage portal protein
MEFFKRLFRSKERSYSGEIWTALYPSDTVERALLEHNKEWVYISVDRVARAVASVRFKVMKYTANGDDQEIFDGELVDFLEAPSTNLTGKDFIYLNTVYKELTGNAFWEIEKKNIAPLLPHLVNPVLQGGKLVGFEYYDGTKKRALRLDQVLHDRYIDPRKPYWGVGKLEKIARWVDTSFFANEFLRLFFVNGAQFGGFIETEEESEERIKLIKLGLTNEHVGVQNSHKIAVLPKGSKFAKGTANLKDMQFQEMDDQYRDKILAGFGVPKTLVGYTTDVNRASAESSEYVFAKYTVKPAVDDLIEFLNARVAPLFDASGKLYFAYDDFVPENMEIKLKEREISLGKQPYKTVNEVRSEVGLPPVEGGDTVYTPVGVPLGEKPPAPLAPSANDNEPKKAMPRRARQMVRKERVVSDIVDKIADVVSEHVDPDEVAHKEFVGRVSDHEKLLADKVRDFNGRQEREVVERLGRITKGVAKSDIFDHVAEVAVLVDFVSPLLRGLFIEEAIEEYRAQGYEGDYNQNAENISRIISEAAKRLALSYNDTTANLLKKALNDGIAAGDDIGRLTERVREVYEYSNQVRAEMVARTESFYIANEANKEAYRQSGVVKSIRWYTAEDERVCEFCGPMNGKIIDIDEVFFKKGDELVGSEGTAMKMDYRAIDVPPLHTNCRCFVRPESVSVN